MSRESSYRARQRKKGANFHCAPEAIEPCISGSLRISEVLTKEVNGILIVFLLLYLIAMKNISDLSDLLLFVITAVSNAQIQRYWLLNV